MLNLRKKIFDNLKRNIKKDPSRVSSIIFQLINKDKQKHYKKINKSRT